MRCFSIFISELGEKLDAESTLKFNAPKSDDLFKNLTDGDFVRLKDIATLKRGPFGGSIKKEIFIENSDDSYQVYEQYNAINNDAKRARYYISQSDYERLSGFKVESGDILMSCSGTIGKLVKIPDDFREGVINQALLRIRLNKSNKIHSDFFIIIFNYVIQQLIKGNELAYGSAIKNIASVKELKEIKIPLPPIQTQQKIITIMDTAYQIKKEKEAEAKRLLDSIDDYVLSELGIELPEFEHKMCFSVRAGEVVGGRADSLFYRPKYKKFYEMLTKVNTLPLSRAITFESELWDQKEYSNEFSYIEISNINTRTGSIKLSLDKVNIKNAPSRARKKVQTGDILVSLTRPTRNAIAIVEKEENGAVASTGFEVLRVMLDQNINRLFLLHILRTKIISLQMEQRSSGGNYPAITSDELKRVLIPIPEPLIQQKIATEVQTRIDTAEQLKADAQQTLNTAKAQVEAIILGNAT